MTLYLWTNPKLFFHEDGSGWFLFLFPTSNKNYHTMKLHPHATTSHIYKSSLSARCSPITHNRYIIDCIWSSSTYFGLTRTIGSICTRSRSTIQPIHPDHHLSTLHPRSFQICIPPILNRATQHPHCYTHIYIRNIHGRRWPLGTACSLWRRPLITTVYVIWRMTNPSPSSASQPACLEGPKEPREQTRYK